VVPTAPASEPIPTSAKMIRFMAILLQVASGASVSNSNSVPRAGISSAATRRFGRDGRRQL
jgi:hypothetical protein